MGAMMRWPDLLVLGAAKSGTTSLHQYLSEHPEIYMSRVKEPGYFTFVDDNLVYEGPGDAWMRETVTTNEKTYRSLFDEASGEQLAGESSPVYLHDPAAPRRIHETIPTAKLIVALRNPIDRAFSHFRFMTACGREPEWSFLQALKAQDERIADRWEWGWSYRSLGCYHQQLTRYLSFFDRQQLHVLLFEDLERDPIGEIAKIFRFLNVDSSFVPDTSRKLNVTNVTRERRVSHFLRSTGLRRLVHALTTQKQRKDLAESQFLAQEILGKDTVDEAAVDYLRDAYRSDIEALTHFLDRDLDAWMRPGGRASELDASP
jgi:hypothetical protein